MADFKAEVIKRGFDNVGEVHAETLKAHPELKIEASDIIAWGYDRLSAGQAREALPLMRFAVKLTPSSSSFWALAESYERSGDRARAVDNYREALTRDPGNIIVKQRLDELAGPLPR